MDAVEMKNAQLRNRAVIYKRQLDTLRKSNSQQKVNGRLKCC